MNKRSKVQLSIIMMCILLLAPTLLFAEPHLWIDRFDTCVSIDLASTSFKKPTAEWSNAPTGGQYGNANMLSFIGAKNSPDTTSVIITSDWVMRSASDSSLKRPFSVVMVPRVDANGHYNYPNRNEMNYPIYGYRGSSQVGTFTLPKTNGSNDSTGTGFRNVTAAWIDIVLVFDPVLNANGLLDGVGTDVCNVGVADDYYGQITITLTTGNVSETQTFYLNGYYGVEKPTSKLTGQLIVSPNTSVTNAFDIKANVGFAPVVADVAFTATSKKSTAPKDCYIFASSSSSPNVGGAPFMFKRRGSSSASNEYNSCTFTLTPTATINKGVLPHSPFDGTLQYLSTQSLDNMIKATVTEYDGRDGKLWNLDYEGTFLIDVTGPTDKLLAGVYDTNVYVHVISII